MKRGNLGERPLPWELERAKCLGQAVDQSSSGLEIGKTEVGTRVRPM